ncbi:E3 ubiquitin-protein ligase rad18 [Microbotryomycetes sp. JL201]|nr:E3 ubiquitin-protein ligase rad18 [Microbotryomycetes sp. JL201]
MPNRQSLQFKKVCPTCNAGADEGRLRANAAVDSIVKAWIAARKPLLKLQDAAFASTSKSVQPAKKSSGKRVQVTSTPTRKSSRASADSVSGLNGKDTSRDEDLDTSDIEILDEAPARKSSRLQRSSKDSQADLQDPSLEVTCPMCGGEFTNAGLSMHIDRCNGSKPVQGSSKDWSSLWSGRNNRKNDKASGSEDDMSKHIARATYSIMNTPALSKLIKEHGLPAQYPPGASTSVKQAVYCSRLQHWTTIWNANADLAMGDSRRKTRAQLISDLMKWEKTSKYENRTDIESNKAAQSYAREHETEFQRLTREARESYRAKRALAEKRPSSEAALSGEEATIGAQTIAHSVKDVSSAELKRNHREKNISEPKSRKSGGVRFVQGDSALAKPFEDVSSDEKTILSSELDTVAKDGPASPLSTDSLPSPPRWLEDVRVGESSTMDTNAAKKRARSPSPYDPRGPRPSQMVRGIDFDLEEQNPNDE